MRIVRVACNTLLLLVSISIALVLGEIVCRLALDKIDYLRPEIVEHPVLVRTIRPGSGGHDDWGFRNDKVPENADIVAIGDSQTYGFEATSHNSWPSWLSRISGQTVYNMGIGGYGPLEYRFLLIEDAIKLKPKHVVIALYFGNDLWNAYESLHRSEDKLTHRRSNARTKFLSSLRNFLSKNSVLYQAIKNQTYNFLHWFNIRKKTQLGSNNVFMVHSEIGDTVLEPQRRIEVLDQSNPKVKVGLSETLNTLSNIKNDCVKLHTNCMIVLIPTKETVYWPIVKNHLDGERYDITFNLVELENIAHNNIIKYLKGTSIPFVDCLEAMRSAATQIPIYPIVGGHPNAQGYEVIARCVWKALNEI